MYSGDIEGKMWFGVQSSDDAGFFGGEETEPNTISYFFTKDDLKDIKKGIATCRKTLGENEKKLDDFFTRKDSYNDKILSEETGIEIGEVESVLEWYARLKLGKKILACVEKQGDCSFEVEC